MSKLAKSGLSAANMATISKHKKNTQESIKNITFEQIRPRIQIPYMSSKVLVVARKKNRNPENMSVEERRQISFNRFDFAKHVIVGKSR